MKKIYLIFVSMLVVFSACKKNTDDTTNNNSGWTEADWAFYDNVLTLQDKAYENYVTWSQTMDSLEAINKLHQFFISDPSVSSATISSQGITIQYTNGLRGLIFLNPQDGPAGDSPDMGTSLTMPCSNLNGQSLVNNKKMILLDPHYWDRINLHNKIYDNLYNNWLSKVGFSYVESNNLNAKVSEFAQLSGYGLIYIYSHGAVFPDENNIETVYLMTGEVVNRNTTNKYLDDFKNGNLVIGKTTTWSSQVNPVEVYFISEKFIAAHNDFSKDTVLFYGAFCYSFLGGWDQLYKECAKGTYFGFTWSVFGSKCTNLGISLIDSLCDTVMKPPYNPEKWIIGSNPPKSYYDEESKKTVSIQYVGDATLTLWKDSATIVTNPITDITPTTATGGGTIKSDGGSPVKDRGVVWSTAVNPTINDFGTRDGSGIGSFISEITGLRANTTYYVRAYATKSAGTTYGNQVSFTTTSKYYSTLSLSINVAVSWKYYDKENNLLNSGESDLELDTHDVPCIQNGNTLTASFPSPCSGTISLTLNAAHSLLSYTFNYQCAESYGYRTFDCTVNNVPYQGDLGGEDMFLATETYPLVQSFDARYNYNGGDYITYELIRNTSFDIGTMVTLGYTAGNH